MNPNCAPLSANIYLILGYLLESKIFIVELSFMVC